MLNAVWVAVIVAVAFWVIAVCVAVYVMLKAARLVSETTSAVADARGHGQLLAERAGDASRRAHEQLDKAELITASLDGVTTRMAELNDQLTALTPAARAIADRVGAPLARLAAVVYGVSRALGMRRGRSAAAGNGLSARRAARVTAGRAPGVSARQPAAAAAQPAVAPKERVAAAGEARRALPRPRRGSAVPGGRQGARR
jgi:uncharacterized protein YoxC